MYPICVDTLQTFLQVNYDRRTEKATYRGTSSALPKKSPIQNVEYFEMKGRIFRVFQIPRYKGGIVKIYLGKIWYIYGWYMIDIVPMYQLYTI